MQHVHLAILALPGHEALAQRMQVAHIYGDANPTADAASRGYFDALHEMLTILGAKPERVPHPAELDTLCSRSWLAIKKRPGARQSGRGRNAPSPRWYGALITYVLKPCHSIFSTREMH